MESLGSGSRADKLHAYNDALVHSATCSDSHCQAYNGRCHKVKVSRKHFVECYGPRRNYSPVESCESCSKFWGLLCFHARTCEAPAGQHCIVPQCDYLRVKIARKRNQDRHEQVRAREQIQQQRDEWPVERRIAQVEQDRQQVLQIIADIKASRGQQVAAPNDETPMNAHPSMMSIG